MHTVSPSMSEFSKLLDARFKTAFINIRAEIRDSEERLTNKLQIVEDKLDRKVTNHEKRITRLEDNAGLVTPQS